MGRVTSRRRFAEILVLFMLVATPSLATAQVSNGNFENGLTGWTSQATQFGSLGASGAPMVTTHPGNGTQAVELNVGQLFINTGLQGGGIMQTVSVVMDGMYKIAADVAAFDPSGPNDSGGLFQLFWDGNAVGNPLDFGVIDENTLVEDMVMADIMATAGQHTLAIFVTRPRLNQFNSSTGGITPRQYIDNVTLSLNVPEPQTLVLLGLGLLALYRRRAQPA